jgi:predicted transcriptional regulator
MENEIKKTIVKSIRFETDLAEKIQEMADNSQRDFTKQVRFMLLEYIRMVERR